MRGVKTGAGGGIAVVWVERVFAEAGAWATGAGDGAEGVAAGCVGAVGAVEVVEGGVETVLDAEAGAGAGAIGSCVARGEEI